MSHTPGPWHVSLESDEREVNIKADEWYVAVCCDGIGHHGSDTEGNARLIAAAPDLLAALRDIATMTPVGDVGTAVAIARAAIAKATGDHA